MGEGQGDGSNQQKYHLLLQQHQLRPAGGSYRMRGGCGGEIVEVQGGHIMRSTGRKDRHSKVCTAKGPRDRRVRLSAHTAIQFYDVQDRLGYDRPSKAVDWLIKNAKAAIDELEKLPPWNPTSVGHENPAAMDEEAAHMNAEPAGNYDGFGSTSSSSAFFPPSLDSDSIADTIKSFFPVAGPSSCSIGFQSYQTATRGTEEEEEEEEPVPFRRKGESGAQDLRLSLQSYQDPMVVQHSVPTSSTGAQHHTSFFPSSSLVYDGGPANGWADHNHPRGAMGSWMEDGVGGYVLSVPQAPPLHPALGQSSHVTQRGPLQSSNPATNFGWVEAAEHGGVYSSAFGLAPGSFSRFQVPTRAQGEEEQNGFDKPTSAFSGPRR